LVAHLKLRGGFSLQPELLQHWGAQALQLCRTSAAASAAGAAAAQGATATAAAPAGPLRLRTVTCDLSFFIDFQCQLHLPLLQELEAVRVEELWLHNCSLSPSYGTAATLGRLTALQVLRCSYVETSTVLQLPPSLQRLSAQYVAGIRGGARCAGGPSSSSMCLDLRHLTNLRDLECHRVDREHDVMRLHAMLPPQLTQLEALELLSQLSGARALQSVCLSWDNAGLLPSLSGLVGAMVGCFE
jgi:hypothetical protein